jgi:hypothetical protein
MRKHFFQARCLSFYAVNGYVMLAQQIQDSRQPAIFFARLKQQVYRSIRRLVAHIWQQTAYGLLRSWPNGINTHRILLERLKLSPQIRRFADNLDLAQMHDGNSLAEFLCLS